MTGAIRIVLEGDSRTNSFDTDLNTYRHRVYELLTAEIGARLPGGMTFSFIGSITTAGADSPTEHHLGSGGSRIGAHYDPAGPTGFVVSSFGPGKSYNCEVLVLMIGINNTSSDDFLALGKTQYPGLLTYAQSALASQVGSPRFVVVRNYGRGAAASNARNDDLNTWFDGAWDDAEAAGIHIYRVDLSGVNPTTFPGYYNGELHLTEAGNRSDDIAGKIFEGIMTAMGYPA